MKSTRLFKSVYLVLAGIVSMWIFMDFYYRLPEFLGNNSESNVFIFANLLLLLGTFALGVVLFRTPDRKKVTELLLQRAGKMPDTKPIANFTQEKLSQFDLDSGTDLFQPNLDSVTVLAEDEIDFLVADTLDGESETEFDDRSKVDVTALVYHSLDPITESNVLLRFGRNDQAIELLLESLGNTENRHSEIGLALISLIKQEIDDPDTDNERLRSLYRTRDQALKILTQERSRLSEEAWLRIHLLYEGQTDTDYNDRPDYLKVVPPPVSLNSSYYYEESSSINAA